MKYFIALFTLFLFLSCINDKKQETLPQNTGIQEIMPIDNFKIDSTKYAKSNAIIKGKLIEPGAGNKYLYPKVLVLEVLKNSTDYKFIDTLTVAHYNWKSGIPKERDCIIYLTSWPLGSKQLNENQEWMLIEGDGEYACECQ